MNDITPSIGFWPDGIPRMSTVLPDGATSGRVHIKHTTITKEDAMMALFAVRGGRGYVREGDTYAEMREGGTIWMSDTRDERNDHRQIIRRARGHVLIGGLGLGMVTLAVALKADVSRVTVIERNPDVIAIVCPALIRALGPRADVLTIIEADMMTWSPPTGEMYDTLWFDIWPTLCVDDLAEHATLNRRFARRKPPGAYSGCWGHDVLVRERDRDRRERQGWGRW